MTARGYDTHSHRVVFPLESNLYGRSIGNAAPHRFLPGTKGGLYGWSRVSALPEIILVEGMFDLPALWQAGFRNVTCALGNHLNTLQLRQLCDGAAVGSFNGQGDPRVRRRFSWTPAIPT